MYIDYQVINLITKCGKSNTFLNHRQNYLSIEYVVAGATNVVAAQDIKR